MKKKTILSLVLFAAIFGGLLLTATFTDLQVSEILTKGTLPPGQYYATGVFGVVFECIGTCPELLLCAVCAAMLTLWALRIVKPGAVRTLLVVTGGAATVGLYLWEFSDLFGRPISALAPGSIMKENIRLRSMSAIKNATTIYPGRFLSPFPSAIADRPI